MLGGRRKREGEGRHGQRGEKMEEEREEEGHKEGRERKNTACTPEYAYRTFSTHFLHAYATSW